jgi:transketolase
MNYRRESQRDIRRLVLQMAYDAGVGHIGSALSVADILLALYEDVLNIPSPDDGERDRFVLSKGHAALALYAILHMRGWISAEDLQTYCGDNSTLGVHPDQVIDGVDFSTGSLGHGLSMAAGSALAARMQDSSRRVYALISDAECNAGSVWEAAMFCAHQELSNITAIIDCNGQQALGYTRDVLDLQPLASRWQSFGWHVEEVDGHDIDALSAAFAALTGTTQPRVVIANTVLGSGVSFMERLVHWHYWPMNQEQFKQALEEISGGET